MSKTMRRTGLIFLIVFCVGLFFVSAPLAFAKLQNNSVVMDVDFLEPQIIPSAFGPGYNRIEMEGLHSFGEVGEPVLPIKALNLLIPPGSQIKDVEVILGEKIVLPGRYLIEPGQRQYPLSQIGKIKIVPDEPKPEVYQSQAAYPGKIHKLVSIQKKKGYGIAFLSLSPVEYNPSKNEISYYKRITVVMRLKTDHAGFKGPKGAPRFRTKSDIRRKDKEDIVRLIDDKEDIVAYDNLTLADVSTSGATPLSGTSAPSGITALSLGPIDPATPYAYVIITHSSFVSAFDPLKARRTQQGLPATIVTTDWIYANYPGTKPSGGEDDQTKIRNFIIDAYNTWGTQYVLLAGDADGANVGGESGNNIIPARGLSDATYPIYRDDNIPADLYYACLDGTFDSDKDGIYGEANDGETGAEVDLTAEVYVGRAPVDSVAEATNFVNKTLAYEGSTDTYLEKAYMLGERLGFGGVSEYATAIMEEIRFGSSNNGYTTSGFMSNPDRAFDADTLYDSPGGSWPKTDLVNVINNGVHILNHLGHANNTNLMKLTNSDVDSLMNNRYFMGYSQGCYAGAFDNRDYYNTYLSSDSIVEHLVTNPTGAFAFVANSRYGWGVTNSTNSSSQFYDRQFWDALFSEGIMELGKMNQDSKEDNIAYLGYSMNRWCYFEVNLFGDPAVTVYTPHNLAISLNSYAVTGENLNKNGLVEAGETIELTVSLKALNQDAFNVSGILDSIDPYITMEKNNSSYGIMQKGESKDNDPGSFRFSVSGSCPSLHTIMFDLTINANGYSKKIPFQIDVVDPRERLIAAAPGESEYYGVVAGNIVAWESNNGKDFSIWLYDLTTDTKRKITFNTTQGARPSVYNNYIVWEDSRNGNKDIYLYDLATNTERQITTNTADQTSPVVSDRYIIWEDSRNGNKDIYLYDLATNTERQITTNTADQKKPAVSGNYIVWCDYRNNGNAEVYLYSIDTNIERQITSKTKQEPLPPNPAIDGNRIVWTDARNGNLDIYLFDISTDMEEQITFDSSDQYNPAISGHRIVWQDLRNGDGDIYLYDLNTRTEKGITFRNGNQMLPAISGDKIVWTDFRNINWDIYLYDLGDITPPSMPVVTDQGAYTSSATILSASWLSSDVESGIAEYQYAIGTSPGATDVVGWTSTGANTLVTHTGLSLLSGTTYYINVKAKNGAGLWSEVGYSDGIKVDNPPVLAPIGNKTGKEGQRLFFYVNASDVDNNPLTLSAQLASGAALSTIGATFTTVILGDFDKDGMVGTADLGIFKPAFGSSIGMPNYNSEADFDNNGVVNTIDYFTLQKNYAKPSSACIKAGAFSWTPNYKQAGDYSLVFTVSDGMASDTKLASIHVNNVVVAAPVVTISANPATVAPRGAFTITISASSSVNLASVWWTVQNKNNPSQTNIPGTVNGVSRNLAQAQDSGAGSGKTNTSYTRTVTITGAGNYKIAAIARDSLYPISGESHQTDSQVSVTVK